MKLTVSQMYFAFVIANVFCKGIGLNSSSVIYKIIMVVGLIGVLIGISTRKYSRKEIFISAVMLLSGIMTLLITKQYTFLITCIAAIGIKKADVDRLMKNVCSIRTMCFGSIFCLALLNIIDRDQVEIWRNTGYVSRYGMGYGHPNILHLTLFIVLTLNYYLNIERKNDLKKFWIIAFVLNIFVYRYSASRTGFIVISIFELLILTQKIGIARKKLTKLPVVVFCMLMGFTYMTPFLKNLGMLDITTLFNGRVSYTYLYLASWAGLCPGNNESAGKRKTGRTTKGNCLLRETLITCAHAAILKKDTYFYAQFQRISAHRGKKRAYVAVAHSMLTAIYHMLKDGVVFKDLGADYYNQFNRERKINACLRKLERLGYRAEIAAT